MSKKLKVLLVMHKMPVDSGFLATKFIRLSQKLDVHLLVWDSKRNVDRFLSQNNLPENYKNRIHLGNRYKSEAILEGYNVMKIFLTNKRARKFIANANGRLTSRIKFVITYLKAILLNPDIIHFEFGTLAHKATELRYLLNTKLSVSFRGYDLNYVGLDDSCYYTQVWQNFDGFHFLGNDLKNRAIKRGYVGGKTEVLIPPAVDTVFYKPSEAKKNNDKLVIVSVGRLVWKKGYEYGIRAVAVLKEKGISFEYWIIGGGDNLQAIQYTIEEFGLQSEVKLQGEQNAIEIKNKLEQAHVFLHPAISEGFSNAVLEAQAMGVPVICTDADGLAENIEDGITGFVVPKWDEKAIADKLLWCSTNRDILQNMGRAGTGRVNKLFRIEDQVDAFVKYYQKLAGDNED